MSRTRVTFYKPEKRFRTTGGGGLDSDGDIVVSGTSFVLLGLSKSIGCRDGSSKVSLRLTPIVLLKHDFLGPIVHRYGRVPDSEPLWCVQGIGSIDFM